MSKVNYKDEPVLAKLGSTVFPFSASAVDAKGEFIEWNIEDNFKAGKWSVINFYPADFTFVCPTEIKAISEISDKFEDSNAEVVVASVDSTFVHAKWREADLGAVKVKMLSDNTHAISKYFGIYSEDKGVAWRGTFIISPKGQLYVNYSTFGEVGRSADEILRLLQAAQQADKGYMIPCEWHPGEDTL